MASKAWTAWKRVAHGAAEFQATAMFFVLYFIAIVPMRLLGLGKNDGEFVRARPGAPAWTRREPASSDLASVRRQF